MGIIFILIGVFTIVCTLGRFPFYWDSRKAMRMRRLLGDTVTSIFYYIIGLGLVIFGVLVQFNIVELQ